MGDTDPYVHIGRDLNGDAAVRATVASAFGLVGELPGVVTTGCGLRVPRARTSGVPDQVTCLACREHAAREHLRHADQLERLAGQPGMDLDSARVRSAVVRHRDLATRFSGLGS
ncbi:hypothetical protein [Amycolatopsis samaneae]|uniref:Uncharacterized protein n=1 Tax=Amycolatopsis samaneae TaxID=664691 RepID=A0ABW5GRS7_9PSEU